MSLRDQREGGTGFTEPTCGVEPYSIGMPAYEGRGGTSRGRAPMPQGSLSPFGVRSLTNLTTLGAVLFLALSPILASQSSASSGTARGSAAELAAGPQGFPTATNTPPTNVNYCGLLGPNPGTSAGLPEYVTNVSILWFKLCAESAFVTLINQWGDLFLYSNATANDSYWVAGNLTPGWSILHGGPPTVNFAVNWFQGCDNGSLPASALCFHMGYWNGSVTTNALSGPFFLASDCPSCSAVPVAPPTPGPISAGFPYGLVLGFSLAGAFAVGVVIRVRHSM
jgi:hypothetical protein